MVILGICGIVLIFASSIFKGESKSSSLQQGITAEEYRKILEDSVSEIVREITGDKRAVVVVTLENGMRYSYADATVTDAENFEDSDSTQESSSASRSYITVRTADGGEKALIVTEYMPDVRGVAIVCSGGDNEQTAEKIKGAVTAALHITSKRVYITGGN